MTSTPVRWGLVGTGGIARRTVGDLRAFPSCAVVAVASRAQETANAFASEWSIPQAFGELRAMLESDSVDAVYVGTPHTTHAEIVRSAILAGKHVVCEKPLTMTSSEAEELGMLAASHGVFLLEGMWMSFSPAVRRMLTIVADGEIGEPRLVQAGLGFAVPADFHGATGIQNSAGERCSTPSRSRVLCSATSWASRPWVASDRTESTWRRR